MVERILCVVFGHSWDRDLRHGHPSKRCDRCQLQEWALRAVPAQRRPGAAPTEP